MKPIADEQKLPEDIIDDHLERDQTPETIRENGKFTTLFSVARWVMAFLIAFSFGLGSGYLFWGRNQTQDQVQERVSSNLVAEPPGDQSLSLSSRSQEEMESNTGTGQNNLNDLIQQINPPGGYALPIAYGDIGPQLLSAGAIDFNQYQQIYEQAGQALADAQKTILQDGSDAQIVINQESAYFLLNFFWAFGLTNQNSVLTEGPMMQMGEDQIGQFASTGGWTIGKKPATELYASIAIVPLSPEQQLRLEEVASSVYRPCCNNPTIFPDCNHGMAMLGMLELMASQDATVEQMFEAAKYVNAYWFPQQTLEIALFHKTGQNLDFSQVDPQQVVGPTFSSGSGFQAVHQWLTENNVLEGSSGSGSSCGV